MNMKAFCVADLKFPELLPRNSSYVVETQTIEDYSSNSDGSYYKFKFGETYFFPCDITGNDLLNVYKKLIKYFEEQRYNCNYYEIPVSIKYSDNLIKTFDEEDHDS